MLLLLLFHFLLFCMRMSMSVCDLVHHDLNASPILYHIYMVDTKNGSALRITN